MNKTTLRLLLLALIGLTVLVVAGIKLFVRGDSEDSQPQQAAPAIFNQEAAPRQAAPVMRTVSEVPGGGDSIEMFSKTNKGYYGEDEEGKPAAAASTAAAKAPAPAAARAVTKAPAAKKTDQQVIPRIQPVQAFGASAPKAGSIAPTMPGGSMPDMSSLIQNVTKEAAKKSGARKTGSGD